MDKIKDCFRIVLLVFAGFIALEADAAAIMGKVVDEAGEPLIGATVLLPSSGVTVATDVDGKYEIPGLRNGTYVVEVSYVFFQTQSKEVAVDGIATADFVMQAESQALGEVVVTAQARRDSEGTIVNLQKNSFVVQTGVSAQQIKRTQDSDASEVIKRVPGISLIDDRFVMVRGLSQRYNNVWLNNSAVPSSEADSRAYSFDMIPSSQLDNMIIIKSPSPEYPADFSGGFVLINTKDIPAENMFKVSLGGSINENTHFSDFKYALGSGTDFLGFDSGFRSLNGGINGVLNSIAGNGVDLQNNGFNNDWRVRNKKPVADVSFNAELNRRWIGEEGQTFALLGALNYTNSYRTILDMTNALFGAYDTTNDRPVYLRNQAQPHRRPFLPLPRQTVPNRRGFPDLHPASEVG